jgi:hypothetical protein
MRHYKGIIFIVLLMVVFLSLISLLIPSRILSTQGIAITIPADSIYKRLNTVDSIKKWHPVFVANNATANGNALSWKLHENDYSFAIDAANFPMVFISFNENKNLLAQHQITVADTQVPNEKQIQWQTIQYVGWLPWNKFAGIMLEKEVGNSNKLALEALKRYLLK